MRNPLRALLPAKSPKSPAQTTRPGVEALEDRLVPTVTWHGGAVLPQVEAQAVYLGSDWYYNPTYYGQAAYLDGFVKNIVNSPYMDMLTAAGYGVGRGWASTGRFDALNLNKAYYLTDSQIRADLLAMIDTGTVQPPLANRVYVVFVEDNVAVMNDHDNNATSQRNFLGYHTAFGAWTTWLGAWRYDDIHYAVIPYPGGWVGNGSVSWEGVAADMTLVASHELAEAVTDPDAGYKALGWYDSQRGEVGDICVGQTVYVNGYAVQRIADRNDQAMTPAGASAARAVHFVLRTDGNLYLSYGGGLTWLASGVASVSDQGIDDYGRAMVDIVLGSGNAWEYHEGSGSWTYLGSGVKSAKAGQGVSYVLSTGGRLYEYRDAFQGQGGTWAYIDSGVMSIDAGTDRYGVNMVAEVGFGAAYEHSDSTGWHLLGYGIRAVSAGQRGILDILFNGGVAYWYSEAINTMGYMGSNVVAITTGTDQYGNYMIDVLLTTGTLLEYRVGSGWSNLGGGVVAIDKGHGGAVDVIFSGNVCSTHDQDGWYYLTSGAQQAA